MPLKLFAKLLKGSIFHFGDRPNRILIAEDKDHYIAPEGRRKINPFVAVVEMTVKTLPGGRSIYDKFMNQKGDSDE